MAIAATGQRPKDAVIAQVTGEHPELARSELEAIFEVLRGEQLSEVAALTYRGLVPRGNAEDIARRAGLLRYAGRVLAEADDWRSIEPGKLEVKGSFAVRATILRGAPDGLAARQVEAGVGDTFRGGRVNLDNPAHVFRVFVGRRAYLTHEFYDRVDDDFEERAVKHRPFFKPVSLHPKFARALVNLTRVHEGQELLDPFCGTGGILIEAGLVGAKPVGMDADPEAARGTAANLEHFGLLGADIREGRAERAENLLGRRFAAIATDPPYGRSASTLGKGAPTVLAEAAAPLADVLLPGGYLGLCIPQPAWAEPFREPLLEVLHLEQRVHASLTRHYFVFRKGSEADAVDR